jgi:hypothetical protein
MSAIADGLECKIFDLGSECDAVQHFYHFNTFNRRLFLHSHLHAHCNMARSVARAEYWFFNKTRKRGHLENRYLCEIMTATKQFKVFHQLLLPVVFTSK